jgi:predicted DNA-binding protein
MQRTNIHLTDTQLTRLRALSGKTGAPVAVLIRRAIDAYLSKRGATHEK